MRILVTGNLGYIGTVLTRMLIERGYAIQGYDSDLYERCTFGNALPLVVTKRKDIRDAEREDIEGFDTVMHLAALSNDPLGDLNPDLTYEINYKASVRLAELAKQTGVRRFIFSSSCSNYGAAGDDLLDEESPFNPVTPYGKSKVLVEREVSKLADDAFSPVFLRNATAYGVSPRIRFDLVLNNLVAWAYTTSRVMLKSDGSPWRPIVHVEDISAAFIAAAEAPLELVHNQSFNVGSTSENFRIRDIAGIVANTVPNSTLSFAEGASPDSRCYRVNCDRIKNSLGFETKWTVQSGARQLYDAYTLNTLTLEEFEGPRYQRIGHIRMLIKEGLLDDTLRRTGQLASLSPQA